MNGGDKIDLFYNEYKLYENEELGNFYRSFYNKINFGAEKKRLQNILSSTS
jgi:hypothetical protein